MDIRIYRAERSDQTQYNIGACNVEIIVFIYEHVFAAHGDFKD